jgi:predicted ribosome quality control (RQC) complex YloA/Tae2 family protein
MRERGGSSGGREPGPTDPEQGLWQGRAVASRFVSPDGMTVLVGKSAADNDLLSIRLASPRDFWFHVAAGSGSHVVVRNPGGLDRLPRETLRYAAALAAGHSKVKAGGKVAVHWTRGSEVRKRRGAPAGEVMLGRYETISVPPLRPGEPAAPP